MAPHGLKSSEDGAEAIGKLEIFLRECRPLHYRALIEAVVITATESRGCSTSECTIACGAGVETVLGCTKSSHSGSRAFPWQGRLWHLQHLPPKVPFCQG